MARPIGVFGSGGGVGPTRRRGPPPITVVSRAKSSEPMIGEPSGPVSSAWNPGGITGTAGFRISKIVAHLVQRIFFTAAPAKRASS